MGKNRISLYMQYYLKKIPCDVGLRWVGTEENKSMH